MSDNLDFRYSPHHRHYKMDTRFMPERNNTVLRIKPASLLSLQADKFCELTVTPGVLDDYRDQLSVSDKLAFRLTL